ncbi:hypothetical protein R2223_003461 [Cronobacter sakazakii]|nr:hypothetical protein [Cronobacter sakazakii]EKS1087104.1 hypothetical protein [Cronobacter sakazakii]ELQ5973780.1 hypothetical protein [Cronobacter sakazakii]ELQ6034800.1 hypothetical protein [Cronobacter sakazakii]ELQ6043515.1 hypothetical protein [Cronobacter sakazakii]
MTARGFYTQKELDEAKSKLQNLPDLTPQRITRAQALENLKDTILMLAKEKGYTPEDIKSALDSMKFNFSVKSIAAVISEEAGTKKKRQRKTDAVVTKANQQSDQQA